MLVEKLEELGKAVYRQSFKTYTAKERKGALIFGLDSEWQTNSYGDNKLLCWTLSLDSEHKKLFPPSQALTWDNLYSESVSMLREAGLKLKDYTLFCYGVLMSTAELQWLNILDGESTMKIYGTHQVNARHGATSRRSMLVFDLSTWFPGIALKDIAQTFGLKKLEYDVTNLSKDALKDSDFIRYALNDAYLTGEILRQLRDKELKESQIDILLCPTPGSCASADFRNRYVPKVKVKVKVKRIDKKTGEIKECEVLRYKGIYQRNATLRRAAMLAAKGGRWEAFYRGEKDLVFWYDATSFYPSIVQAIGKLPLRKHWLSTVDLDEWLAGDGGFGKVWFRFPADCNKPCLPCYREDGQTVYPSGQPDGEVTWASTFEVKLAIEQGAEITLLRGYRYKGGVPWLSKYMQLLVYQRQIASDEPTKALAKAKSVAVIGKLFSKHQDYDLNQVLKRSKETGIPTEVLLNTIGEPIEKKTQLGSLFFPEWYSVILGAARANISSLAIKTDALQIATDAVFTESYMGTSFEHNGVTYNLKGAGEYVSYRPGLYRLDKYLKFQGANREIAEAILDHFLPFDNTLYKARRITSLKMAIWTGRKLGSSQRFKRTLRLTYDGKRLMLEDGNSLPLPNTSVGNAIIRKHEWYEPLDEEAEEIGGLKREMGVKT